MLFTSPHRNRFRRSRKPERGSASIELSLTLLPLMAMVMGIVDFTMPIFLQSLFTHAVTQGARYGITYQTRTGQTHSQSIKSVVQENAAGFLNATTDMNLIQVKFYSPLTFSEVTGPNANVGGNIVEVSISGYNWTNIAPIWRSSGPLAIRATSADRLEMLPKNVARPAP